MRAILDANNQVIAIVAGDSVDGIPCTANVSVGMQYVDGQFIAAVTADNAPLEQARAAKAARLKQQCQQAITHGFSCAALGEAYWYPNQLHDQQNLHSNVLSSLGPALPSSWRVPQICCDAAGNWEYRPHSVAQIQAVGRASQAAIQACLEQHVALQVQLQQASTVQEIEQIVWSDPSFKARPSSIWRSVLTWWRGVIN